MKIRRLICLLLLIAVLMQLTVFSMADETEAPQGTTAAPTEAPAYTDVSQDTSVTNGCRTIEAQMPLLGKDRKLQSTAAAFLYEVNSDTVVYAWNPDEKMIPASLAKIMTALLAVENADISDVITISEATMSVLPKAFHTLELQPGEIVTLEQMLYCMMVGSANDAATVIAAHVGGSEAEFVAMMNQRAKEIGCVSTNFINSTGLDDPDQYTTARDMAKIVAEAMKNELFMEFFSATLYTLPETNLSESKYMESTNYLMLPGMVNHYDERVTGGRTGVTENRTRCLAVTAEDEDGELSYIGIVLEAQPTFSDAEGYKISRYGSYEDMKDLLNLGFTDNGIVQIFRPDQVIRQYAVSNGANHLAAGPAEASITVLPNAVTMADLTVRYLLNTDTLTAPIKEGDYITMVELWYGGVCLDQVPLLARNTVEVHIAEDDNQSAVINTEGLSKALMVIGIILGIVLCIVGVLYIVQFTRRAAVRAQHRRRRKSRRRSR